MERTLGAFWKTIYLIVVATIVIAIMSSCSDTHSNDGAEKDEEGRYLTIINATEQIINEVHVTVGDGTEIESMEAINPDKTSFSLEIPEEYEEYSNFVVTLVDRYDLIYQKEINNVLLTGRTEVKITADDYVEEDGDWWAKINQFFNGD